MAKTAFTTTTTTNATSTTTPVEKMKLKQSPTKIDITNAFKDFEKSLAHLCEILINDRNGKGYVDEVFKNDEDGPFPINTMQEQVKNVKGWVEYLESEIGNM